MVREDRDERGRSQSLCSTVCTVCDSPGVSKLRSEADQPQAVSHSRQMIQPAASLFANERCPSRYHKQTALGCFVSLCPTASVDSGQLGSIEPRGTPLKRRECGRDARESKLVCVVQVRADKSNTKHSHCRGTERWRYRSVIVSTTTQIWSFSVLLTNSADPGTLCTNCNARHRR